ncbi:Ca-activated chloride channel family protein [Terribacillus aidingensis]|uniref:Ca-activated chloride channel family protein n=1 Tax=Terribacillus aidingensis TaxID=586416 RepID=A0A285N2L4_9BACI|nr:VWA domain-containing protein [Terribacillus aidingensis]SNZ03692.1 Ca-activated chloride channel family protein [Terribacillus aidingensis]
MKKRVVYLILGIICFLAGCSTNSASDEPSNTEKVGKETETKTVDMDTLSNLSTEGTLPDLKKQPAGRVTASISEDTADADKGVSEDAVDAAIPYLKDVIKEDNNPDILHRALIASLGSPSYKETIEAAEALNPSFEDPYLPRPEAANKEADPAVENSIILLDASSSMLLEVDGEQKMRIAKDAVESFAKTLGSSSNISLIVYGHKGSESDSDMELSCKGIEEVYPSGAYDAEKFTEAADAIDATGWTPLAGAIEFAAEKSSSLEGATAIYIVSDGKDTCGGDPIKAAEQAASEESGIVNVIGFNVDEESEDQLAKVAEAGTGEYYSANSAEDLQTTIEYEWLPSTIDLVWAPVNIPPNSWEVLDEYKRQRKELDKVANIMRNEEERYEAALAKLTEDEIISEKLQDEVTQLIQERFNAAREELSELEQNKIDGVDARQKEIREEVEIWVEEMKKLKEKSA